ncbi:protein FAM110C [Rhineura floridana]|uniref:protein FAM110C n=1 Tax=Rhineura floridana TaxID=261503 RepID=UPI002AC86A8D|nr:protein FAM110C [Rhineura floridana]XP_061478862.1 protein FAM110C [Rhineura floridana]
MPTELSHVVRMHAISGFHSSLTVRLFNKGPEYLRKQMEAGNPGRKSAVERLAADKAKYVKSQQVINTKQEPVSTLSSASESTSSSQSSSMESKKVSNHLPEERRPMSKVNSTMDSDPLALEPGGPPIVRRSSAKRLIRPDSLVIYRQKCEFVRGQSHDSARGSLVRRLFQGSVKEKQLASEASKVVIKEGIALETEGSVLVKDPGHDLDPTRHNEPPKTGPAAILTRGCENASDLTTAPYEVKRKGLHRSQSDISSRYSKSFSEFDIFFKYCGLEPEVIEDLGKENFSVASDNFSFRIRSISMATSESDFTRHSGDDGLLEEELTEQVPTGTSVIERNARIIKWLYTCKKAKEANTVL